MQRFLLLALSVIILASCQPSPAQLQAQRQRDVANLASRFDALEQLQIKAYRNQDWCKNIVYRHGKFSNHFKSNDSKSSTCNLFDGAPHPFDAQAQQDFDRLQQAIAATGVKLLSIDHIKYAADGTLISASFQLTSGHEYVYAVNYKMLPETILNEREPSSINKDWYFVQNDWN